ncbi:MAG: sensor domain-containing diguanylate cyclase [Elusimicrobia bacterium]|nr:sensor domain-containing diguanylate cyclase [Elusimicrobiota bacterium]
MKIIEADARYAYLHRLRRELRASGLNRNKLLTTALKFFHREIGAFSGSVFLMGEHRESLHEILRIQPTGEIEPGQNEEPLWEGGLAHAVLYTEPGYYILPDPEDTGRQTLLLRLRAESSFGALISREPGESARRAQGIVELTLDTEVDWELLNGCMEELGEWLELSLLDERLNRQSGQIESFGELSWLFVTSLRIEDRLRLIMEGIQRLFGFDRVRLYLSDALGLSLIGEIEVDLGGKVHSLAHEKYPRAPDESRSLVEILWASLRQDPWARILEHSLANHEKVLYLPLKIQTKEIGVLVVDNLISQETIPRESRNLLQSLTGQIALAVDNARLFSEVEKLSLYDSLSHLPNRRYFEQRFREELYRASRRGGNFALCLLDLDFFKEINDVFGHQMGDAAIRGVGQAVNSVIRQSDFAARWGGDEVAILLGDTQREDALLVAGRILEAIRAIKLVYPADPPKPIHLTASLGIAFYPGDGADLETLTAAADRALYHVKFRGRDGLALASEITQTTRDEQNAPIPRELPPPPAEPPSSN